MRLRLKSPASRLFTQPFIRAQIKVNIKAPRHRPVTRKMFPFDDVIMKIVPAVVSQSDPKLRINASTSLIKFWKCSRSSSGARVSFIILSGLGRIFHLWIDCFSFLKLGIDGGLCSLSAPCFKWNYSNDLDHSVFSVVTQAPTALMQVYTLAFSMPGDCFIDNNCLFFIFAVIRDNMLPLAFNNPYSHNY